MTLRTILVISLFLLSCTSGSEKNMKTETTFSLSDFFSENAELEQRVNNIFNNLDAKSRIAQMIVTSAGTTGKPTAVVEKLIREKAVGGILMLSGEKENLKILSQHFDSLAALSGLTPILYSSDAEPSLINRKIKGTQIVPNTIDLTTIASCDSVANIITNELLSMNIRQNYAPVLDLSPNNEAITNRTFGNDSAKVVKMASAFVKSTQAKEIVATVKHFPGHGLVSGDTHNQLVSIDGEMRELSNYIPLIDEGVLSVMVGHIAVRNNEKYETEGFPASCSRVIVTDLLKGELGFKGIVITDAMNMGALRQIDKASLKAVEAGCDMILMEPNELQLLNDIYQKYQSDVDFRTQVDQSVKKILRLKACLNLI